MILRLVCTLILFCNTLTASAGGIELQPGWQRMLLNPHIDYLADPDGLLHIGQFADDSDPMLWQSMSDGIRRYVTSGGIYWFRTTLDNPGANALAVTLELPNPAINVADLYVIDGNNRISVAFSDAGIDTAFENRPNPHRHIITTLSIPAESQLELVWRIEGYPTLKFSALAWEPAVFFQQDQQRQLLHGMVYGSLLVMALYNLFLFVSTQERSYLFYVLFLLSSGYMIAADEGHVYQFIATSTAWAKTTVYALVSAFNLLMFAQFSSHFLQLRKYGPRYRYTLHAAAISATAALLINTIVNSQLLLFAGIAAASLLYLTALLAGLRIRMRGVISAGHFVIAILMLASALIISNISSLGLFLNSITLDSLPALGTTLMMIFLSLALADRINQLQRENADINLSIGQANRDRQKANTEIQKARREHIRLEQRTNQALRESQAKSDFLATMSHEIRTPMSGILGMTELLKGTTLDNQQTRYLNTIEQSGQTLLGIINDLQDFSNIEAGKLELVIDSFNLHNLIDDCVSTFALRANEKQLNFIASIDADVPEVVRGDNRKLQQIILNLLSNAFKFTDHGDVIIRVSRAERSAVNWLELKFSVEDSGIGLTEQEQERLFTPFQHADSTTYGRYGGSGLGLAISKQLAELMDGQIGVNSEPGKGSLFWFTARLMMEAAPPPALVNPPPQNLAGKRLLLVEPNATNREILVALLQHWEIQVTAVASAAEALSAVEETALGENAAFQLVIFNHGLPDMDGLGFAERVHGLNRHGKVPCIMMSSGQPLRASQLEQAGIISIVDRPLTRQSLRDSLLRALGPDASGSEQDDIINAPWLNRLRVLLVDDNQVNQLVLKGMLARCGIEPEIAANGIEALARIDQQHFDLILMDCEMPEMDGYEATKQLRLKEQHGEHRAIVVGLSAHALSDYREKAMMAGMDAYLTKPVSLRELIGKLSGLVNAAGPDPN